MVVYTFMNLFRWHREYIYCDGFVLETVMHETNLRANSAHEFITSDYLCSGHEFTRRNTNSMKFLSQGNVPYKSKKRRVNSIARTRERKCALFCCCFLSHSELGVAVSLLQFD